MKQYKKMLNKRLMKHMLQKLQESINTGKVDFFKICIKSFYSCNCMLISNLLQEKSVIKNTLFGDEMAMKKTKLHVSMQGATYINHLQYFFLFIVRLKGI